MNLLPNFALQMIKKLKNVGYEAYAVGGCVRDAILGRQTSDIDITTSALPGQIQSVFPNSARTGGKFLTVTVFFDGGKAEITTFRSESEYSDLRRPDSVNASKNVLEDLERRDFTVNSIRFDGEKIIDSLGGIEDIKKHVIRCIGNPEKRFSEDALRIMRAFRFAAALDFDIEFETLAAALRCSEKLRGISVERIRDELIKISATPYPERALPLLDSSALRFLGIHASPLLPMLKKIKADEKTRFAAFLYICGRDAAGFLRLSNTQNAFISRVFAVLGPLFPALQRSAIKRSMNAHTKEAFSAAAEIAEKILGKSGEYMTICEDICARREPYRISDLAVNGEDLIAAGIGGEKIGEALEGLLQTVIDFPEKNEKQTLLDELK